MLDQCPKCSKFTIEVDSIARIKRCLNTSCMYVEYGNKYITLEQIDEIGDGYRPYSRKLSSTYKPFSRYLNELMYLQSLTQWDK
jgi:hypothetical protein